ncbi:hypothetical protein AUEXF2481DRAFT_40353 [Aureobasidium subglaciale EXF-2481]|uniref:peptidylprolyl isomerase n=1 Tax=Aureobasidium subglaciale (strain EXF-2481) TaxID=1043005 RepID=A0A074YBD8_AURSE|nr:uncharacterized protein AUEXF2481DRAFT_40353 [Aureobasidium subglaciale EXF-2481]KEQ95085.1 hypothetical protein AUEXF2481DRAFT_40353 [Aureobasidium subglaciale EXF-2481]
MRIARFPLLAASVALLAPTASAADGLTGPKTHITADGLEIVTVKAKTCKRPTRSGDDVSVHYRGTLLSNGYKFDESYNRGVPFTFKLGAGEVIKGWDEGLLDMCVGEQRKLVIPPTLAYGHSNLGVIPPDSTLVFETELIEIAGVSAEAEEPKPRPEEFMPPPPIPQDDIPPPPPAASGAEKGPKAMMKAEDGECKLLGPFALIVQAALGALALLSLVFKRWRERPRRPLKIWFFDVSKQVAGTFLLHLANLAMSMFSSGKFDMASTKPEDISASVSAVVADNGKMPNPCSFYLLNLAIDTTIGIPVLVIFLRVLHSLFSKTPMANPPESIKSGYYGSPPRATWWLKQSFIYFIGLFGMKLFVFLLFAMLPWLPWVGDWALRWTEGNEALQIAFVMFIFPVAMNGIQYYIVDSFIKDAGSDRDGFQAVPTEDDEEQGRDSDTEQDEDRSKRRNRVRTTEHAAEANSTAVSPYDHDSDAEASSGGSSTLRK